ncbi:MAG: hypothetical protein J6W29_10425, partial [Neisseriaceae bacterium]|nr:hypothetical protein [Neisseriaceae bacterium]
NVDNGTVTSPSFTNNTRPTSVINSAISFGYQDGVVYRDDNGNDVYDGTFQRPGVNSMPGTPGSSANEYKPYSENPHSVTNGYQASGDNKYETPGAWGANDIAIGTNAAAHGNRQYKTDVNFYDPGSNTFDVSGYYTTVTSGGNAIAIGNQAQAVRTGAIAMGYQAEAGENAVAIGSKQTRAVTPNSIAIGNNARIAGINGLNTSLDNPSAGGSSIAIGHNANNFTYGAEAYDYHANTKHSVAIGTNSHTHAANALAFGFSTDATGERSFAFGTSGINDELGHRGALASGQGSIVIGDQARSGFKRDELTDLPTADPNKLKQYNDNSTNIAVNDSVAIGTGSLVSARNALALGGGISYTYHKITYACEDNNSCEKDSDGNIIYNSKNQPKAMDNITRYYLPDTGDWTDENALKHEEFESNGAKVGKDSDGAIALGGASADISGVDDDIYPTTLVTVANYVKPAEVAQNAKRAIAIGGGTFVDEYSQGAVAIGGKGTEMATRSIIGKNASNSFAAIGGKVEDNAASAIAMGENATINSNSSGSVALGGLAYAAGQSAPPTVQSLDEIVVDTTLSVLPDDSISVTRRTDHQTITLIQRNLRHWRI